MSHEGRSVSVDFPLFTSFRLTCRWEERREGQSGWSMAGWMQEGSTGGRTMPLITTNRKKQRIHCKTLVIHVSFCFCGSLSALFFLPFNTFVKTTHDKKIQSLLEINNTERTSSRQVKDCTSPGGSVGGKWPGQMRQLLPCLVSCESNL